MEKLNKALYTLEGIAGILIVIHHCNFPGILGFALDTISFNWYYTNISCYYI